jgi:hypothetical protein
MQEWLDMTVANVEWRCYFLLMRVTNGNQRLSDHRPVIVDMGDRELTRIRKPMEVVRKFEARWLEEGERYDWVQEAWATTLFGRWCEYGGNLEEGVRRDVELGSQCIRRAGKENKEGKKGARKI